MSRPRDGWRRRTALWGLVAGGALAVLGGAATAWQAAARRGDTANGPFLPDFADLADTATLVSIETQAGAWTLVRGADGNWSMPERGGYPVDTGTLQSLARGLGAMKEVSARSSDPASHVRLGVADPPGPSGAVVEVRDAAGTRLARIAIGPAGRAAGGRPPPRHARRAGDDAVWLVAADLPPLDSVIAFLDLPALDIVPERIASVSVQGVGGAYDIVRRPDGGFAPVGGTANINATAAALAISKWQPVDAARAETLVGPVVASHRTTLRNGVTVSATLRGHQGGSWFTLSATTASAEPGALAEVRALNDRFGGWAYQLPPNVAADFNFARDSVLRGPRAQP